MNREAQILLAMATATSAEQQRLASELASLRLARRAALAHEAELDLTAAVVRDIATPVVAHTFHTTATDWIGKVDEAPLQDAHAMHTAARTEATLWFRKVADFVRADEDEYREQATGAGRRWASQFGLQAEAARGAFVQQAMHLAGYRTAAAPEDDYEDDYDPLNHGGYSGAGVVTRHPYGSPEWDARDEYDLMDDEERARYHASRRTAATNEQYAAIERWCDTQGLVMKDFPDSLIERAAESGDTSILDAWLEEGNTPRTERQDWIDGGLLRTDSQRRSMQGFINSNDFTKQASSEVTRGVCTECNREIVHNSTVGDWLHVDDNGFSVRSDHAARPHMMGGRPVVRGSRRTAEWGTTMQCHACGKNKLKGNPCGHCGARPHSSEQTPEQRAWHDASRRTAGEDQTDYICRSCGYAGDESSFMTMSEQLICPNCGGTTVETSDVPPSRRNPSDAYVDWMNTQGTRRTADQGTGPSDSSQSGHAESQVPWVDVSATDTFEMGWTQDPAGADEMAPEGEMGPFDAARHQVRTAALKCEMGNCNGEVTHIGDGGFVYCQRHAQQRRDNRWENTRKMTKGEVSTLEGGGQISYRRNASLRTMASRPLYEIADEIRGDWKNVYFGAVPYLDAMGDLESISDMYGADSAKSIVAYFLSNATAWRGDTARRVKNELKAMMSGRTASLRTTAARALYEIADEIRGDWKNVYFGAVPYLDAMGDLDSINSMYGADDARSIVAYFLSNATSWKGDTARRVKAELKAMMSGRSASEFGPDADSQSGHAETGTDMVSVTNAPEDFNLGWVEDNPGDEWSAEGRYGHVITNTAGQRFVIGADLTMSQVPDGFVEHQNVKPDEEIPEAKKAMRRRAAEETGLDGSYGWQCQECGQFNLSGDTRCRGCGLESQHAKQGSSRKVADAPFAGNMDGTMPAGAAPMVQPGPGYDEAMFEPDEIETTPPDGAAAGTESY